MSFQHYMGRFLVRAEQFRTRHIKHRNFLILLSVVVGSSAALAAVFLKVSVEYAEERVSHLNDMMHSNWLTAFFPLVGVGISMLLLKRVFRGKLQRGVGFIVESILTKKSRIERKHTFGQIMTSIVTVALGGSVGLEAPIVAAGASIGSNTAFDFRLSYRDTTLMLACGVASGIAAIFNSPIAGIIFALEVLLFDFNIPFLIPLLISTATATVISQVLYPHKFVFLNITGWNVKAIPFYILLGLGCGFISVYTTTVVEKIEHYFHRYTLGWKPWLMAGILLCATIFVLPPLYGEGYGIITNLLHGKFASVTNHTFFHTADNNSWLIIVTCLLLIAGKAVAAALTVSAGGNGGTFGPALVIGGLTGFVFAFTVNELGLFHLNTSNFIIAAMAGVLAGVMHAPLTAIFLLAEITGGYTLFVPLMIVSAVSYFITRKYIKHSMYHRSLVERSIIAASGVEGHDHL